jgi:hypothetical protein
VGSRSIPAAQRKGEGRHEGVKQRLITLFHSLFFLAIPIGLADIPLSFPFPL